jgi:hypothetical protein
MVPPGSARSVEVGDECIDHRDTQVPGEGAGDLPGRVDPILEPPRQGSGYGHERKRRNTGRENICHQPGVRDHAPILEVMDEDPGHAFVLESGDEPKSTGEEPIGGGTYRGATGSAELRCRDGVTAKTDHVPLSIFPRGQIRGMDRRQAVSITKLPSGSVT